jgi:polysaccharide export outer membrane protein
VTVLGAVTKPGRHAVSQTDRVLDVIARAEGLKYVSSFGSDFSYAGEIANLRLSYMSRGGKLMDVDFVALMDDGDMRQNIPVRAGDFIYIPSSFTDQIFVLGEVQQPTTVPYRARLSLVEAISTASGFIESTARKDSVCVVSGSLREPSVVRVNFDDIVRGNSKNIILDPGDIVFVPATFITDVERLTTQLVPFLDSIIKSDEVLDIYQRRRNQFNPYP